MHLIYEVIIIIIKDLAYTNEDGGEEG